MSELLGDFENDAFRMSNEEFLKATEDFFEGGFSEIDEHMPDGAWFQHHVDVAERMMKEACELFSIKKPKGIDGFDIVNHYLERKNA